MQFFVFICTAETGGTKVIGISSTACGEDIVAVCLVISVHEGLKAFSAKKEPPCRGSFCSFYAKSRILPRYTRSAPGRVIKSTG